MLLFICIYVLIVLAGFVGFFSWVRYKAKKTLGIDLSGKPYKYRIGQNGYIHGRVGNLNVWFRCEIIDRSWYGGNNIQYTVKLKHKGEDNWNVMEGGFVPFKWWNLKMIFVSI